MNFKTITCMAIAGLLFTGCASTPVVEEAPLARASAQPDTVAESDDVCRQGETYVQGVSKELVKLVPPGVKIEPKVVLCSVVEDLPQAYFIYQMRMFGAKGLVSDVKSVVFLVKGPRGWQFDSEYLMFATYPDGWQHWMKTPEAYPRKPSSQQSQETL